MLVNDLLKKVGNQTFFCIFRLFHSILFLKTFCLLVPLKKQDLQYLKLIHRYVYRVTQSRIVCAGDLQLKFLLNCWLYPQLETCLTFFSNVYLALSVSLHRSLFINTWGDQREFAFRTQPNPNWIFSKTLKFQLELYSCFFFPVAVVVVLVVVFVVWLRSGEAWTCFNALVDENKPIWQHCVENTRTAFW